MNGETYELQEDQDRNMPKDKLYFISSIDEKNRFYGLNISLNKRAG